ncbi:hypothetical protein BJ138DRAFT_1221169 [Hygrophoropsis aurantiaca]|uniref:Uncharacterized protein n=1 Tax=Hygrophoropsis aurantiaca TaxID=72124 RepID=A0ACB8AJM8_9AGAM|nr:hypothetical protein BJ138DRAFT_1221169 [Hygrophoropsis aurantiaca]
MFVMFYFVAIFMTVVTGLSPSKSGIQLLFFAPGMTAGFGIVLFHSFDQTLQTAIMTAGLGLIQMAMQKNVQGMVDGFMAMTGAGVGLTAGSLAVHARFAQPNHVATVNALMPFCFTVMNAKIKSYIITQIRSGTLSASDLETLANLFAGGGFDSLQTLDGFSSGVQ